MERYKIIQADSFSWETRYSQNEKADKHGRWARLCFYRGLLIAWISRIEHIEKGTFYIVKDFFPTSGRDMPEYTGKEIDFKKAKQDVEKRFNEFIRICC